MAFKTKVKIVCALFLILPVSFGIWYFSLSKEKVRVAVQKGDSASKTAQQLKDKDLIYSKNLFLALTRITGSSSKIKAGVYQFSQRNTVFGIWSDLITPPLDVLRITVPEGSTAKQISEIMESKLENFNKEKFLSAVQEQNLEGYLMPETYFLNPGADEKDIVKMMKAEFDKKVTDEMYARAREIGFSMKNVITLASIIEKEAMKDEERPIISSVFHNRLRQMVKLESCATVLYAMGIVKPHLTNEDIKFNSPYNTYLHSGLPPGPIANPGIRSIEAALYPASTDKLFFVADGDGGHLFANGFKQHAENRKIVSENTRAKKSGKTRKR
ncbi:MAG: endolytic transglycosylase MltG [Elusimicrobiota bacterium]|jgi:UPF0755 protein|nr:endolytic transglycosylase MltG [Elusimicrobiota bacterium]